MTKLSKSSARHRRIATLLFTLLAGPLAAGAGLGGVAWAQPVDEITPDDPEMKPPPTNDPRDRAKEYSIRGRKNYDLGKFRRAVALYTRAYEEYSDGAFLFNIAQSYRQLDECKQSLFFYKRFLSVQKAIPAATKAQVDGFVLQLEACVKTQDDIRRRPPDGTADGTTGGGTTGGGTDGGGTTGGGTDGGGTTGGGTTGDGGTDGGATTGGDRVADTGVGGGAGPGLGDDDGGGDVVEEVPAKPRLLAVFARGGGAKVGAGDLTVPLQAAISLSAGYPIAVGDKLALDVGVGFGFTPVPWANGTASLTTVAAHAGATYQVASKFGLRAEVDVGAMLFGGLEMGNPFTRDGIAANGALTMLNVRAGLAGEYAITSKVSAVVTPIAFAYSPTNEDFAPGIDAITRIEFLAGLGYRM